jgi:hypothetical protein
MKFKFTNPWWVVVGAVAGLFVGQGPVFVGTYGVFLKPIMAWGGTAARRRSRYRPARSSPRSRFPYSAA